MKKPIIAVTPSVVDTFFRVARAYVEAIEVAGGIPFIVSYTDFGSIDDVVKLADGLLLTGGGDISSEFFNQPLHEKASDISILRDQFEIEYCKQFLEADKPVLGICRGAQLMGVACGGDLIQHMENHSQTEPRHEPTHRITIQKDSRLYDIFKTETMKVNSIHHQAVLGLGENIIASAFAEDGTIEGIEVKNKHFGIGVQWHPEGMFKHHEIQLEIFKQFILSTKGES